MASSREYPERPVVGIGGVIIDRGRVLLTVAGGAFSGDWSVSSMKLDAEQSLLQRFELHGEWTTRRAKGSLPRRIKGRGPRSMITPAYSTTGLSGYSLEEARRESCRYAQCCSKQPHRARELTSYTAVYNTLHSGGTARTALAEQLYGGRAVIRCPELPAENRCGRRRVGRSEILSLS